MGRKSVIDGKLVTFAYHLFGSKPWEIMETIYVFFNPLTKITKKREKIIPPAEKS